MIDREIRLAMAIDPDEPWCSDDDCQACATNAARREARAEEQAGQTTMTDDEINEWLEDSLRGRRGARLWATDEEVNRYLAEALENDLVEPDFVAGDL